ncbi:MAG: bacterioferritin [Rhizobiaceae bacterium]
MANKSKNTENLQKALAMELTAMHQYQLHAHVLDGWGLDLLAAKMREEMVEELGHSDEYMERLMFLGASPEVKMDKAPQRAQSLKDMFEADLADETEAIEFYSEAAKTAFETGDVGTRALFERIALDEEGHKGWLELQLGLLARLGEKTFSAKHMSPPTAEADA